MKNKISIFSFFSGAGILDLAFENSGYNIVWVNEYSKEFLRSYQYARQQMKYKTPLYGYSEKSAEKYAKKRGKKYLKKLMSLERDKGHLIGFIGGPPCPDFSVGGKNAGRHGANGKLTKTYFDIICRCKPDFFFFENVKGLISTEKHKGFFEEMKMKAVANGYVLTEKLVNSLEYGVPQSRERIFLIGIQRELFQYNQDLLNQNSFIFEWEKYQLFDMDDLMGRRWPNRTPFIINGVCPCPRGIPKKLTVQYWFDKNSVEIHPNAVDVFNVRNGNNRIENIDEGDTSRKSFKRLHRWRYSPTAAYGHNEVHLHPYLPRRLSVSEAMAIQSVPKTFVLPSGVSLSAKFKMISNGVPYKMALAIAKTLKDLLVIIKENYDEKNDH